MKRPVFPFATAAALLAATAGAARTPILRDPGGWPGAPADCPLTIAFTSYGAGIDQPALVRVERRLRTDRRVRQVTRHPWGREGEVTLCVRPRRYNSLNPLARDLRGLIPTRPHAPIQVTVNRALPH